VLTQRCQKHLSFGAILALSTSPLLTSRVSRLAFPDFLFLIFGRFGFYPLPLVPFVAVIAFVPLLACLSSLDPRLPFLLSLACLFALVPLIPFVALIAFVTHILILLESVWICDFTFFRIGAEFTTRGCFDATNKFQLWATSFSRNLREKICSIGSPSMKTLLELINTTIAAAVNK
jgi:hypothetical protein